MTWKPRNGRAHGTSTRTPAIMILPNKPGWRTSIIHPRGGRGYPSQSGRRTLAKKSKGAGRPAHHRMRPVATRSPYPILVFVFFLLSTLHFSPHSPIARVGHKPRSHIHLLPRTTSPAFPSLERFGSALDWSLLGVFRPRNALLGPLFRGDRHSLAHLEPWLR